MIVAPHCIRNRSPQRNASDHSSDFIHFFISFNEEAIAHNITPTNITISMISINDIVSTTIVPIIPPLFFLF